MPIKLYKYRPINDFLFKEILYQEIYLASLNELNDPLEFRKVLDFTPRSIDEVFKLWQFIMNSEIDRVFETEDPINNDFLGVYPQKDKMRSISADFKSLIDQKLNENDPITFTTVCDLVRSVLDDYLIDYNFTLDYFESKLDKINRIISESTYIASYSSTKCNSLMWAHYASGHRGICLEFEFPDDLIFSAVNHTSQVLDNLKRSNTFKKPPSIDKMKIHKVDYPSNVTYVNFFDVAGFFDSTFKTDEVNPESDTNTINSVFKLYTVKSKVWEYESEWRMILLNSKDNIHPESRIINYPVQYLTGISFGNFTPPESKSRIYNILKMKPQLISFFDSSVDQNGKIHFNKYGIDIS